MTAPLVVLVLAAPALLLAAAVAALWALGPVGWVASVLLVAAVVVVTRATCRHCWTWWLGTRAPELAPGARPAGASFHGSVRVEPAPPSAGTGPGAAERPARPGGTTPG